MKKATIIILLVHGILISTISHAQDEKYIGAIIKESDVPKYTLPDLLTSFSGKKITSLEEWTKDRRPEIMDFFTKNIYGKRPDSTASIKKSFKVIEEDKNFMEGLCTKKRILVTLYNTKGSVDMQLVTFLPNRARGPVPVIYHVYQGGIKNGLYELENLQKYGQLKVGVPLRQILTQGIGLVATDIDDLIENNTNKTNILKSKLVDLCFEKGQTNTTDEEWGIISVWAYGLSIGMDYLETQKEINAKQVALMGCSVNGKAALWAAAQDQRFGMVLSNTTGHGGDAIWRRQFGETFDNMCEWLPLWFGKNAQKYKSRVTELPVDQHMLLACIAPRPIFISNGEYDYWADPKGSWVSAYHAMPVYRLYGRKVDFSS